MEISGRVLAHLHQILYGFFCWNETSILVVFLHLLHEVSDAQEIFSTKCSCEASSLCCHHLRQPQPSAYP